MLAPTWAALGGDPAAPAALELRRAGPVLASPLAVEELLTAAAGSALLAAAELAERRTGRRPAVALDVDGLAVAAASERHLRLNGQVPGEAFAPLSAFLAAADGWIRTHANYPWHHAALLRALGTPDDAAAVRAAVRERPAVAVERAVAEAGGAAAAVRAPGAWTSAAPLVAHEDGPATDRRLPERAPGGLPAAGARVLDLTRVIAGPVGTRMLAALGAAVTRVDDPRRPELPLVDHDGVRVAGGHRVRGQPMAVQRAGPRAEHDGVGRRKLALEPVAARGRAQIERQPALAHAAVVVDQRQLGPARVVDARHGGVGKRRLALDLRTPAGRDGLERELATADAVVLGARPGALDRHGLAPDALAARHPHAVVVTLTAWGGPGPSGALRGFDSLVQAATGIAEAVRPATPDAPPGALPVQALDHATGYLVAAATLRALAGRERTGRAGRAQLALAATAAHLLAAGRREPEPAREPDPAPHLVRLGDLVVAAPPGSVDGQQLRWPPKMS